MLHTAHCTFSLCASRVVKLEYVFTVQYH